MFRISLRVAFVVTTIVCIWLGYKVHHANQQKEAVEWVENVGGVVWYDFQYTDDGLVMGNASPPGPLWLRDAIGVDYFATVVYVELAFVSVADIRPLADLTGLRQLELVNVPVDDLSPLTSISTLERLDLHNTKVAGNQISELRQALPHCHISWAEANGGSQ